MAAAGLLLLPVVAAAQVPAASGTVQGRVHDEDAAAVFGAAPQALTGVITLQQTVDLVKLSLEVVESNIDDIRGFVL